MPTRKPVDGAEVVAKHWPVSGPHDEETIASAAMAAEELQRYMAHATIGEVDALPYACDGYTVVGRLATAAHSERQVLQQLAGWADGLTNAFGLCHDTPPGSANDTARAAAAYLREAAKAAESLAKWLRHAQGALGHLYHDGED